MEPLTVQAILQLGPVVAALFFILWPFCRDKLFPAVVEERKAKAQAEKDREERLYSLIEKSTAAFTEMRGAVEELRETLTEMRTDIKDVRTDVTFLYARLNVDRRPREL